MLKKKFRLGRGNRGQLRFIQTPFLTIKISKNNIGNSRFGFIVSKKIDKRATVRNRMKRVLRSEIENNLHQILEGLDFMFVVKKNFSTQEEKTRRQVLEVLKRERYIK